jgi:hypothetical protein
MPKDFKQKEIRTKRELEPDPNYVRREHLQADRSQAVVIQGNGVDVEIVLAAHQVRACRGERPSAELALWPHGGRQSSRR